MADAPHGDRRRPPSERKGARAWIGEHGWEVALLGAAAGILCALVFGHLAADPDLWGHVRFGQLILAEGLPEADPYAYTTAGRPWINHEVLAEVAFGWAYGRFGAAGLQLVRYAVVGATLLIVWREMVGAGTGVAGAALGTALVTAGMGAGLATIRPHLFTYLFFLLVLVCIVRADRPGTRWMVWLVPAVVALWINVHGGVLAGVGVVGLWWLGEGAASLSDRGPAGEGSREGSHFGRATLVLAASAAALLANPYGPELPLFLLDTATEARPFISEWQPVAAHTGMLFTWVALTAAGLGLVLRAGGGIRRSHGVILGVLALLPLLAMRHMPLYALGWGVLLAPHAPDVFRRMRRRRRERLAAGRHRVLPEALLVSLGVLVAASGFVVTAGRASFPCIPLGTGEAGTTPVPRRAVGVLERSGVSGKLATPFDWGEYVIWHLAPGIRVGMDGRRETVYPDSAYRAYRAYETGTGEWYGWLERYGAEAALVKAGSPPDNLLALKEGWREVHRDDRSAVYGRDGWPGTERIAEAGGRGTEAATGGCFPGAPAGDPGASAGAGRR